MKALEEKNGAEYSRRRAAADRLERIESTERKERERHRRAHEMKHTDSEKRLKELSKSEQPLIPNGAPTAGRSVDGTGYPLEKETHFTGTSVGKAGGHAQDWEHHQLTPMQEVPTRDEM